MNTPIRATDSGIPFVYLTVKSDGNRPQDTEVRLSDGTALGYVQRIQWDMSVNGLGSCVITTLLTPAQLKVLASDLTIKYQLIEDRTISPHAPAPKSP